ncbi:MAG: S49 family peptidase [Verrucomicrobiales bacterium]
MHTRLTTLAAIFAVGATMTPCRSTANPDSGQVVPVYDLQGMLTESGNTTASILDLNFSSGRPLTFFDVASSIAAAVQDENVPAVVLDIDEAGLDLAQVQELRRLLLMLRKAGKNVHLYTENLGNTTALLGGVANHLTLMPSGGVTFTGLYSEAMYYKGLFDKVGVKVDVVHIGDFKSAGETFSRKGPSKASQQQDAQLLDALYGELIEGVAVARGLSADQVRALIDDGALSPKRAKSSGLVDELAYRTDFIRDLRDKYSTAHFDKGYKLPDLEGPKMDSLFDLMKLMFKSSADKRFKEEYIVVIPVEGTISDASVKPVRTELLRAASDEKCKGAVMRVNSPGGSALASDVLWEATAEFKASGKPFAVSMAGVAASGGYYISVGADRIFAERGTVTGSIGVVGMKIALGGVMEKAGIQVHGQKRGKFADSASMSQPMNQAQVEVTRRSMLDVYATFKKRIMDGRGDRIKGDLEKLAGGRVYAGSRALELGLVDQIGGVIDAVNYVAAQAKMESPPVHLLPEATGSFDGLFGSAPEKDPNDEFIGAPGHADKGIGILAQLRSTGLLSILDAYKQRSLEEALQLLEAARTNSIMLIGPALNVRLD